jgi:hypothetical protein
VQPFETVEEQVERERELVVAARADHRIPVVGARRRSSGDSLDKCTPYTLAIWLIAKGFRPAAMS